MPDSAGVVGVVAACDAFIQPSGAGGEGREEIKDNLGITTNSAILDSNKDRSKRTGSGRDPDV